MSATELAARCGAVYTAAIADILDRRLTDGSARRQLYARLGHD
jgi:hypothetical protein